MFYITVNELKFIVKKRTNRLSIFNEFRLLFLKGKETICLINCFTPQSTASVMLRRCLNCMRLLSNTENAMTFLMCLEIQASKYTKTYMY